MKLKTTVLTSALLISICSPAAQATLETYNLQSPAFGGTNAYSAGLAQQTYSSKESKIQAQISALKAAQSAAAQAAASSPSAQFTNSILSQLNGLVAYNIASKIANATPGSTGAFQSGNNTVSYVNSGGVTTVTITSPNGTTTLALPSN
ncbi:MULTISPECIES: curli assembly protein CsgF [unclassified Acidiphilium]|jgi:hypothetical protein|uniref:curli assembly protein CsgF n=1 Tax=unclassified Acidiphilium TaxID=2617493 RepID=UPI000BCA2EF6|nr:MULTISPECIES: curli assembly protein CsgF [unclassified Acidiphilium]OYV57394.1 MAG: hypothetical protein B7Z76_01055 [Acidiphilium sp. 20-67-58]HQT59747.1 curli assembly protein CsgF [Acidiphilium sp.]